MLILHVKQSRVPLLECLRYSRRLPRRHPRLRLAPALASWLVSWITHLTKSSPAPRMRWNVLTPLGPPIPELATNVDSNAETRHWILTVKIWYKVQRRPQASIHLPRLR